MQKELCPICNTHNVIKEKYDENDNTYSYMCLRCGYTSNDHYVKSDEIFKKHYVSMSELIKSLQYEDQTGKIWIPSIIASNVGMLYPFGTNLDWEWWFVPIIKITEEEKDENKYDSKYNTRFAIESKKTFDRFDFLSALKEFGDLQITDGIQLW